MAELKDILMLSVDERINIVQTIWDSIAADTEIAEISKEHKEILDERIKTHRNNPKHVISLDDLKKSVRKVL